MTRAYPVMPGVPAAGHVSGSGYWHSGAEDRCQKCHPPGPRTFTIRSSDIARCPAHSLSPAHYRDDGTCYCER